MKSLVVLFAGEITGYGLESFAGHASALARSVSWAREVPGVSRIAVLATPEHPLEKLIPSGNPGCDLLVESKWTAASFFSRLSAESADFDQVVIAWADCPFLDSPLTGELFKKHLKYAAEYTFADGYPYGLAPDILARGIVPILANMAKEVEGPVTRDLVFETLKKDINSFDIETDIAPVDLRQLRLSLTCDTRRNTLICAALEGITAANYGELVQSRAAALRPLPAFYAIQVAGACPYECVYCPYPAYCRSGKGTSPGIGATERTDLMSLDTFAALIDKIASFSEDAVVSLSLWGECAIHPDIAAMVAVVLAKPGLSVLIETTGLGWKEADLQAISGMAASALPRRNAQMPINWIVSLDAVGSACYGAVHGITAADQILREALAFTEQMIGLFPGSVWPQMIRMNDNETELETFYRFWKQKLGQVIIQKHDHFCGSVKDRRVADLSPLVRNPCWHLKRDMSIMIDGTVPMCREDIYATRSCGNAVRDDLSLIWANDQAVYEQHAGCVYGGMCGACDEYYTYNF